MTNFSDYAGRENGPMIVSGGLSYAIRFAEALGPELRGHDVDVMVSGIRDGLYFYDDVRDRAVRITMNSTAGCGRMYIGKSGDFEYETKVPQEALDPRDWEVSELAAVVKEAAAFLVAGSK
ncbi:hypothetical protein [Burkholderia ambifaria]|uniref:hypothetical protein n=1 Tax=Burkholderia ambifaria TaxID=152480 RepID=UPI002FE253EA